MKISQLYLRFIRLLLCVLPCGAAIAQNEYLKVYGTPDDDVFYRLDHCSDGGYILLGRTNSDLYRYDAVVTRTNASGDVIWSKTIQFDTTSVHLIGGGMLEDESYVIILLEYNPMNQPMTILVRLDAYGDSLWTKTIFSHDICCLQNPIIPLNNGEFLLASRYHDYLGGSYFGSIQKIDSSGNTVFTSTYSPAYLEVLLADYILTPDSEIVAIGSLVEHITTHPTYTYLIKHDINGNFISGEIYADSTSVSFTNIVYNADHTFTISAPGELFLKTDTSGGILSALKNIGIDHVSEIHAAPDSGFLIRVWGEGFGQLTPAFDTVWTHTFPSLNLFVLSGGFYFNSFDHSITLTANTDSITNIFGNDDGILIHLDSSGNSACIVTGHADIHFQPAVNTIFGFDSLYFPIRSGASTNPFANHQITFQSGILTDTICSPLRITESLMSSVVLSPNPVTRNTFNLRMENSKNAEFLLMGIDGKLIPGLRKEKAESIGITFSIPPSLANGIYFLKIVSKDESAILKLVVAR